jgi:hypothetical protein
MINMHKTNIKKHIQQTENFMLRVEKQRGTQLAVWVVYLKNQFITSYTVCVLITKV